MKTLKIEDGTHERLTMYKRSQDMKSYSRAIDKLLLSEVKNGRCDGVEIGDSGLKETSKDVKGEPEPTDKAGVYEEGDGDGNPRYSEDEYEGDNNPGFAVGRID